VAYYRGKTGRQKRARQNRKRYLVVPEADRQAEQKATEAATPLPPMLKHVRMVVGLIEGRAVSWGEIEGLLVQNWRQHPIGRWRQVVYVVQQLNKGPP
jgi:hypothetical protein